MMNADDREILTEMHLLVTQCHKALYGNGKAGLIERMDRADSAYKTLRGVGVAVMSIVGFALTLIGFHLKG